jgi:hypothetical protein
MEDGGWKMKLKRQKIAILYLLSSIFDLLLSSILDHGSSNLGPTFAAPEPYTPNAPPTPAAPRQRP